jgi:hypothetical protein
MFGGGISSIAPPNTFGVELAYIEHSSHDPLTFNVNPGDQMTVSFTPTAALGVSFPNGNPNAVYSYSFSTYAQTDLSALASLFSLSINMSSTTPGQVGVNFTSNPLLGLNDAAITSELLSGFQYNSGTYSFDPTGEAINATFTVPDGVSEVTVSTGMDDESQASIDIVPEPSTVALLGIGAVSLLAREWHRRTAKA